MRYIIISLAIALISFALFGQVVFGASTTATTVATSTFTTIPASMVPKDDPTKVDMLVNDHNSKMIMRVFGHTFGYTSFVCSAFPTSTPVSTTTAASAPKCTSTDDRKNVTIQLPAKVADYLEQLKFSELKIVGWLFIDAYTLILWTYRITVGIAIAVVGLLVLWTSWIGRQAWQARQVAL